jgi:hypothetical protein
MAKCDINRHKIIIEAVSAAGFDIEAYLLALEIEQFLESRIDHDTVITGGVADGFADLYPVIGGIRYRIGITEVGTPVGAETIAARKLQIADVDRTFRIPATEIHDLVSSERRRATPPADPQLARGPPPAPYIAPASALVERSARAQVSPRSPDQPRPAQIQTSLGRGSRKPSSPRSRRAGSK